MPRITAIFVALFLAIGLSSCASTAKSNGAATITLDQNPQTLRAFRDDPGIADFRHSGPIDILWYDDTLRDQHIAYAAMPRGSELPAELAQAERQIRRAVNYPIRFGVSGNRMWIEPRGADVDYRYVVAALAGTGLFTRVQAGHLIYQ
ncbi:hypothetical protein FM042_08990 [Aliidiomarina halalkaliphila]|uniref:Lipoprotein n=1 Tax=Aliidiomarina halalkaliphila TaxID=2593535 RepID=A0A552WZP8_9GAMM|nr:hypothetical protein [Aliidiomarina halalkaliphila]TRW48308.1 hypothetical protein FM042_08990 [Aliidiomarina halalkaliphila]